MIQVGKSGGLGQRGRERQGGLARRGPDGESGVMDIAILEAGGPPLALEERFGRYPAMFVRLLGGGFDVSSYDVEHGALPGRPEDHAAYLVTGSPAGVYDDRPWIDGLRGFLQQAKGKTTLVGICFGHQIMAEAFGGRVEKSDEGWGIGLHRYEVIESAPWMDDANAISIPVSHQDQVVALPPHSRILAASAFTPFGMIGYDDQPAMSMQCHPEFDPDYAKALIEIRRERLPNPDAAIASLDLPNDRERVAGWIRAFLRA